VIFNRSYLTLVLKAFRLFYMTDHDRNMRTLVLCFVIAIMALVPLRLVEIGNTTTASSAQVLGETIEQVEDGVVLPNADMGTEEAVK
jgi:hypothetical protein